MINFHLNGYSKWLFKYLVGNTGLYILKGSRGTRPQVKFVNNKPTNEVVAQRVTFYFPGKGVQSVKFPKDYKIPAQIHDMELVTLINPSAYQRDQYSIFFKADGIKKATK